MVKVGPKIPPPTRRELDRQERELKRAQGANAAQLGEPREHLALLVHRKSRSKRPELSALGNSWKKWEKNQRRHEARRLAKAKASIASLGSEGYADVSGSDLVHYEHGDAQGPTVRGDNREAPLPNLDYSVGEIRSVVVDSNDYSLGSVSGEFSSFTDVSVSLSSAGISGLGESSSGPLVPSTAPRLSVDIVMDDFGPGKLSLSTSVSEHKEDNVSGSPKDAEKPVEKSIDRPRLPSQAPPVSFSRIAPSCRSRTTMNAAIAPPRLSSRKSSFIFSEPLDMSKYSNKSYTPTINGDSPKFGSGTSVQGSPDLFGNMLASGKRVDSTTPRVHGPSNLTPRAQASAFVSPKNLVQPADQSESSANETNDWNSRFANRVLPAVHATSARRVLRVVSEPDITQLTLTEDDSVESFDSVQNFLKEARGQNRPSESQQVYGDIGTPPPLQSNARLPSNHHELSKNKKSEPFPKSQGDTTPDLEHNTHFSDTQHQIGSQLNNTDTRTGVGETPSLDGNAMIESRTPVLAPAACITHDKKTKPCHSDEMRGSLLQPGAGENGQEGSVTYPDTPPTSCSGIVPPASTPRSPLLFALGLPSPPWSRPSILPRHVGDTNPEANTTSPRGFVSALKWMLKKTLRYFWQRRGRDGL